MIAGLGFIVGRDVGHTHQAAGELRENRSFALVQRGFVDTFIVSNSYMPSTGRTAGTGWKTCPTPIRGFPHEFSGKRSEAL